jgi:hypothetical protein
MLQRQPCAQRYLRHAQGQLRLSAARACDVLPPPKLKNP